MQAHQLGRFASSFKQGSKHDKRGKQRREELVCVNDNGTGDAPGIRGIKDDKGSAEAGWSADFRQGSCGTYML